MPDYRNSLYERYMSSFKGVANRPGRQDPSWYHNWCEHKYMPFLKGLEAESRILDLGCGHGNMLGFLEKSGFKNAEGVDISQEQVDMALQNGHKATAADAWEYLAGGIDAFDAVIALDFLEHFKVDELMRLMPAVFNSLKQGGLLLVQTPNGGGLFPGGVIHGDLTHLTVFTPGSLVQLLRFSGFQRFRLAETGPVPSSWVEKSRLAAWNLVKFVANTARWVETRSTQRIWTENFICCCRKPLA